MRMTKLPMSSFHLKMIRQIAELVSVDAADGLDAFLWSGEILFTRHALKGFRASLDAVEQLSVFRRQKSYDLVEARHCGHATSSR